MKIESLNKGIVAVAWIILSVAYIVSIVAHIVRIGFSTGHFTVPMCLDNHILEDMPIPVAGVIAASFLFKHDLWPRVVLGLASAGLIFVVFMGISTTAHHKPYLFYSLLSAGAIWTLVTVKTSGRKTEQP